MQYLARRRRNQRGSAQLAEFAPALFIFFLVMLFPLIDLMALACGASTIALIARQSAMRASQASNYDEALQNAKAEAQSIANSGFGKFARLVPVGGSAGSGLDLYVNATDIYSNKTTTFGPNTPVPPPVNTSSNVYEYTTHVDYQCGPFVNLSCVPGIGQVPGLGKPADMVMVNNMAAEFADGLVGAGVLATGGGGGPMFMMGPGSGSMMMGAPAGTTASASYGGLLAP